ncbi:polysaccharide deacetylase family protein [Cerasicoccus arenae]|uniref:polysaccharide deacetylase family protein n=1 Tax=Cerasicoccus arenae TaxID=424488 RepID=UPI0016773648|nr:polysaccharide deacetylase family protein [Cerasicoccus arenae]MBK1858608.1 polysaccharide deacetylase family protein [Cerasicoccus arenae]
MDIDDMPVTNYTVSFPLLSGYHFTDAPPGVRGGNRKPFVGNAAVFSSHVNPADEIYNSTLLCWAQIQEMCKAGWAVANHAYSHADYGLTEEQMRNEAYWNQVLIAWHTSNTLAPNYFVYPSGDTAYRPFLKDYQLLSGGHVGEPVSNIHLKDFDWTDLKRIFLDEDEWSKTDDPYHQFPDPIQDGDVVVDITHGMDVEPNHPNRIRWERRLSMIQSLYGEGGADDMWSASIDEIVAYDIARRTAAVDISDNQLTLFLDENAPASPITLTIAGIPESVHLEAPEGGFLYRNKDVVWVTTPSLGGPVGSPLPTPNVRCIYNGPVTDLDWPDAIELAGVRVLQYDVEKGATLSIAIVTLNGAVVEVGSCGASSDAEWKLFSSVPNKSPWSAKGLRVVGNTEAHKKMEIWVVEGEASS